MRLYSIDFNTDQSNQLFIAFVMHCTFQVIFKFITWPISHAKEFHITYSWSVSVYELYVAGMVQHGTEWHAMDDMDIERLHDGIVSSQYSTDYVQNCV